jgi:hypothetical protein
MSIYLQLRRTRNTRLSLIKRDPDVNFTVFVLVTPCLETGVAAVFMFLQG